MTTISSISTPDWSKLPSPQDDGAAGHLPGIAIPSIALPATDDSNVDLSRLAGRTVVYAYPRSGQPGVENPSGWDMIPGARGCTPQTCSFRDHFAELLAVGVDHLFGLSTQSSAYQRELAARLHLPFAILSDEQLKLAKALRLPTFTVESLTLLKRLTLIIDNGIVKKVFYPVFPPDSNAGDVLKWLRENPTLRK